MHLTGRVQTISEQRAREEEERGALWGPGGGGGARGELEFSLYICKGSQAFGKDSKSMSYGYNPDKLGWLLDSTANLATICGWFVHILGVAEVH